MYVIHVQFLAVFCLTCSSACVVSQLRHGSLSACLLQHGSYVLSLWCFAIVMVCHYGVHDMPPVWSRVSHLCMSCSITVASQVWQQQHGGEWARCHNLYIGLWHPSDASGVPALARKHPEGQPWVSLLLLHCMHVQPHDTLWAVHMQRAQAMIQQVCRNVQVRALHICITDNMLMCTGQSQVCILVFQA